MTDYSLGTAKGTIKIDFDGKGAKQAEDSMSSLETKALKTERAFHSVSVTTGIAGAAMAAGLGLAVNAAIDFEQQLSNIGAVTNATSGEMEAMRKKALQLGADTVFSAKDAASAMEELAKAGVSVTDILGGAADAAVALAAAGGVDLATAATIAANAMNAFGIKGKDLIHVADLIAGAANASAIDVNEFGMSLAQSGAVAHLAGLSFDDLAVAIALMGNAGIKGSDAGTSLKTMLQNLIPVTDKQIALSKKLGLMTEDGTNKFFDQTGKIKSLAEIAGILQTALKGMGEEQKLAALQTLFGSDAIRGAAVLANAGADGFNNLAAAMGQVTAADVAAKRMDNVAGAIEQLKGSIDTAAIALGTVLLPYLKKLADFITVLVNKFSGLDPHWQKLIAFALVAVTALFAFVTVLATIIAAIAGVVVAFAGVAEFIPIVLGVVAAVAALAAGLIYVWNKSAAFRDFVIQLGKTLVDLGKDIGTRLSPILDALGQFFKERIVPAFFQLKDAVEKAMPTLKFLAAAVIVPLIAGLKLLATALGWLIPVILQIAGPVFSALITVISWLIGTGFPVLVNILTVVGKVFGEIFGFIWLVVSTVISEIMAIFAVFSTVITTVWSVLWTYLYKPVLDFLHVKDIIQLLFDSIVAIFSFVFDTMVSYAKGFWNTLVDIFDFNIKWLVKLWDGIKEIITKFKNFFDELKHAADGGMGPLIDFFKTIPGKLFNAIVDLGQVLYDAGVSILNSFWNGLKARWDDIYGWFKGKLGALRDLLPFSPAKEGPFSGKGYTLYSGQALIEDWARGMAMKSGDAETAMRDVVKAVANQLPTDYAPAVNQATTSPVVVAAPAPTATTTPAPTSTTHITYGDIHLNVPVEELENVNNVQELLEMIDRLRNDSRRGVTV